MEWRSSVAPDSLGDDSGVDATQQTILTGGDRDENKDKHGNGSWMRGRDAFHGGAGAG